MRLLKEGDDIEAEIALREGVALLRKYGSDWRPEPTLLGELARATVGSREAIAIADELVARVTGGLARPGDAAEAYAIRAEVTIKSGTLDEARSAVWDVVRSAGSICFHYFVALAQRDLAERLKDQGFDSEADKWFRAAALSLATRIPGHTHLWDTRINDDGRFELLPEEEQNSGGFDYAAHLGWRPGSVLEMPWFPYRDWKDGKPRPVQLWEGQGEED